MKYLFFLICTVGLLGIGAFSQNQEFTGRVKVRIEIGFEDDSDSRDRESLGMLVQYRKPNDAVWHEAFSKESGLDPTVLVDFPVPSVVSIQVTSVDPTITSASSKLEFFTLGIGKTSTMVYKQIKIDSFTDHVIRVPIELIGRSAIKLCVPGPFRSGSVQLVRRDVPAKRRLVYSVASRTFLENRWIAGIEPGTWEIIYLDQNDSVLKRTIVDLIKHEIADVQCD